MNDVAKLRQKFDCLSCVFTEASLRLWCATEAQAIGYGGVAAVHKATGVSRITISKGLKELDKKPSLKNGKQRRSGGGRKKLTSKDSSIMRDLERLVDPATIGDPEKALLWSSKSTVNLTAELNILGHKVSQRTVYNLLSTKGYSLKANRKTKEGTKDNPDRDAQFNFINKKVADFQENKNPVLSVDTKKKENIGLFKNNGRQWHKKNHVTDVNVYDFVDKKLGKAAPYGVYDIANNVGWVSVGISSDTAEFAVESIRNWYNEMGKEVYASSKAIMITADCGGSNGNRVRLWKYELQKLANELNKEITVCHLPPGTSKWNKIEHRMFSQISQNWKARPLIDLKTIVELIGNTKTTTGLKIKAKVDNKIYQKGRKVSKIQFKSINLLPMTFHGEWNYTIKPNVV